MPGQLLTVPLSIAAVGMTVDGREITEKDIDDIVDTYNYTKRGARINLDHEQDWSGWAAKHLHNVDIPGMLGDVMSVDSKVNGEGVKCLYAVLAPNQSFVELNKADQAVYFSIEINRDFMKSGKTYLTGLAVTDYPASLYTDRIKFNDESRGSEDKDVSLLTVNLDLASQPQKASFFKGLFKKDTDTMPLSTEDTAAIGAAVASALEPHFNKINESLNTEQESSEGGQDDNHTDETNEQTEALTQLTEKLDKQTEQFNKLQAQFDKLSNQDAPDTTNADDEPTGENDQYKVL